MNPIIKVENLSKKYRIGAREAAYETFREALLNAARAPWRRIKGRRRSADETLWALRDVSFKVMPGEVMGIIGRNGAGKSTLLKILSRVTEPTQGQVELYGRVGSLLEVGTGFHSELSGRENIFLNGTILGMKRREIERKFDEIVAFAEVERFLDTPMKRYSSGMYMRLAFAVAAHLEPEILVVDEVLAVGDAAFQKKCMSKMGNVAREGRTVLFVSHNMTAIRSLCTQAILLGSGKLLYEGPTGLCVDQYMSTVALKESNDVNISQMRRPGSVDTALRIDRILINSLGRLPLVPTGDPIELELRFAVKDTLEEVTLGVAIQSADNVPIFECRSSHCYGALPRIEPGHYAIRCRIEKNLLQPGLYFLSVGARCASKLLDYAPNAMSFEVYTRENLASPWLDEVGGLIGIKSDWTLPEAVPESFAENAVSSDV